MPKDFDDDISLDNFDMDDMDDFDGMSFGADGKSVDNSGEDSIEGVLKSTGTSIKDMLKGYKEDPLDAAKDFLENGMPSSISSEIGELKDITTSFRDEMGKSITEVRKAGKSTLDAVNKLLPKDGKAHNMLKAIGEKFGLEEDSNGNKGPSKEQIQAEQIKAALSDSLGEFKKANDIQSLIQQDIEAKRHATTEDLLKHIYAETSYSRKFQYDVANAYYRKSLELQYKHLFATQELLEVTKTSFDAFKVQYEAIVKNTSLPDIIKLRRISALTQYKEELKGKFRQDSVETLYKAFDPLKNLKDNGIKKIKSITSDIVGGLAMAKDSTEMVSSMLGYDQEDEDDEFGLGRQSPLAIARDLLLDGAKNKVYQFATNKLMSTKQGKKLEYELKKAMADPREAMDFLQKHAEDLKGPLRHLVKPLSAIASTAKDLMGGDSATTLEFNKKDLNDASIFDNRAHQAIVKVIPMLLGKIYGEIKTIREGGGDPESNEIYYDNRTESFLTTGQMLDNTKKRFTKYMDKTVKSNIASLINYILETAGIKLGQADINTIGMLTGEYLLKERNPVYTHDFLKKIADKAKKDGDAGLSKQIMQIYGAFTKKAKQEPDVVSYVSSYIKSVRTNMPVNHNEYKDWEAMGYTHLLTKSGLADRKGGKLVYNHDRDAEFMYSSFSNGDFKVREVDENSKEAESINRQKAYANKFKKIGDTAIKGFTLERAKEILATGKQKAIIAKDGTIKFVQESGVKALDAAILTTDEVAKIYGMDEEERKAYIKYRFNEAKKAIKDTAAEQASKLDTKIASNKYLGDTYKSLKKDIKKTTDRVTKEYNKQMETVNKALEDSGYKHLYEEIKILAKQKEVITKEYLDDVKEYGNNWTPEQAKEREEEYNKATKAINAKIAEVIASKAEEDKEKGGITGFLAKAFNFGNKTKVFITDTSYKEKSAAVKKLSANVAESLDKATLTGAIASGQAKVKDLVDKHVYDKMDKETKNKIDKLHSSIKSGVEEIEKESKSLAKKGYDKLPDDLKKKAEDIQQLTKDAYTLISKGELPPEKIEEYKNIIEAKKKELKEDIKNLPNNTKEHIDKLKEDVKGRYSEFRNYLGESGIADDAAAIGQSVKEKAMSIDQTLTRGYGTKAFTLIKKGVGYLRLTPKDEEEARAEYFASAEYKAGNAPPFRKWCAAMGYRIKGAVKKGIQKFLGVTRAIDKFLFKKTVSIAAKLPKLLGKGVKTGAKIGFKSTWALASNALDMLPFGMGQAMKLPLLVMGSAADAISKTKSAELEAETGRKQGYLARLNSFFAKRNADGKTLVQSVKSNKTLKWGAIALGVLGLLKSFGVSLDNVIDTVKTVGKGIRWAVEGVWKVSRTVADAINKVLGWLGIGGDSNIGGVLMSALMGYGAIRSVLNPTWLPTIMAKGAFKVGSLGAKATWGLAKYAYSKATGKNANVSGRGSGKKGSLKSANSLANVPDGTRLNGRPNATRVDGPVSKEELARRTGTMAGDTIQTNNPKLGTKGQAVLKGGITVASIAGGFLVEELIDRAIQSAIENGEADWKILVLRGAKMAISTGVGVALQKGLTFLAQNFNLLAKNIKVTKIAAETIIKKSGGKLASKLVAKGTAKLSAYAASATGIGFFITAGMALWDLLWILKYVFYDGMEWKSAISLQLLGIDIFGKEYQEYVKSVKEEIAIEEEYQNRKAILEAQLNAEDEVTREKARKELEYLDYERNERLKRAESNKAYIDMLKAKQEAEHHKTRESTVMERWFNGGTGTSHQQDIENSARKAKETAIKYLKTLSKAEQKAILDGTATTEEGRNAAELINSDIKLRDKLLKELDLLNEDGSFTNTASGMGLNQVTDKKNALKAELDKIEKKKKDYLDKMSKVKNPNKDKAIEASMSSYDKQIYNKYVEFVEKLEPLDRIELLSGKANKFGIPEDILEKLKKETKFSADTNLLEKIKTDVPKLDSKYGNDIPYVTLSGDVRYNLLPKELKERIRSFSKELYETTGSKLQINSAYRKVGDQVRMWERYSNTRWTGNRQKDLANVVANKGQSYGINGGKVAYPWPADGGALLKQVGIEEYRSKYMDLADLSGAHGTGRAFDFSSALLNQNKILSKYGEITKGSSKADINLKPHPILDPMLERHGLKRPLTPWRGNKGTMEAWHVDLLGNAPLTKTEAMEELPQHHYELKGYESKEKEEKEEVKDFVINASGIHKVDPGTKAPTSTSTPKPTPAPIAKREAPKKEEENVIDTSKDNKVGGDGLTSVNTTNTKVEATPVSMETTPSPKAENVAPPPTVVKPEPVKQVPVTPVPASNDTSSSKAKSNTSNVTKLDGNTLKVLSEQLKVQTEQRDIQKGMLSVLMDIRKNINNTSKKEDKIDPMVKSPKTGKEITKVPDAVVNLDRIEEFSAIYT